MILALKHQERQFFPSRFELTLERCQPARLEVETSEPAAPIEGYGLFLGDRFDLREVAPMILVDEFQLAPNRFRSFYVEPLRYLLDRPFRQQLRLASVTKFYRALAESWQVTFVNGLKETPALEEDLLFLGNCRNALDQVQHLFGLGEARWRLDWGEKELQLLASGQKDRSPIPLSGGLFQRHTDEGLEFHPAPQLRPYTPVTFNEKEEVIDRLIFKGPQNSMTVRFASALVPAGRRALNF